jgi:hypothetical protein
VRAIRRTDNPWLSHDWKVKTIVSLMTGGGSRLGFTCRACERTFTQLTSTYRAWAANSSDIALADDVSARWMAEYCPGRPGPDDATDRQKLKNSN